MWKCRVGSTTSTSNFFRIQKGVIAHYVACLASQCISLTGIVGNILCIRWIQQGRIAISLTALTANQVPLILGGGNLLGLRGCQQGVVAGTLPRFAR